MSAKNTAVKLEIKEPHLPPGITITARVEGLTGTQLATQSAMSAAKEVWRHFEGERTEGLR